MLELDLRNNQLSKLPDISHLQNLSGLDLSYNQLRELPDISHLQNLSRLDLSYNQLSKLPDSISLLKNLSGIGLRNNQLSKLPDSISLLKNLSRLDLANNKLSELPDSIGNLQNLLRLDLSSNQLRELPDSIGNLQNLLMVHSTNNQLRKLPNSIGNLQNLLRLDLSSNQLSKLPDSFSRLQNLSELDLSDNPLVNPPIEIAYRGIEAIRQYFRDKAEEGEDRLYEAKLIIIGEGGAGKTTLARKILDANSSMPKAEETTKGIDVLEWHFSMENDQDFRVNIWDFGGQAIYHATHQFFLTKRSLYLLVVDSRKEHPHLDYWLNIVELFSENSPLLIVKNELGDRPVKIDEAQLKGRFENLKESLPTNLGNPQGGSGLELIKKAIIYHISQLSHIGNSLPKTWIKVREKLEEDERNYISLDQYLQICDQNGFKFKQESVTDGRLVLSQYFHDLGSILHFQEDQTSPLYKTVILKPKWGTDAAYKVLDNNQVKQNLGKFTTIELKQIWQDAEYKDMQSELLELMLKFKLCYPLPNAKNTYIAPQLLDANQPEYSWNDSDNLLLNYEYNFMPRGILTRFIVEMHKYIDEPNVWLTGVLLKRDDTWAEVTETYDRREIKIRLSGKNKRDFLAVITHQLDEIHDSFKQLKVKKLIPCNCDVCKDSQNPHFYKFDQLRKFVNNNIPDTRCDESLLIVNVLSLIDDVFGRDNFFRQEQNRENPGIIVYGDVHGDIKMQNPQQGDIHEEIQVVNHQPIIVNPPENPKPLKVKSAWANGSFYLFVFVVVVAGIGFLGKQLDFIVLCVVIIAGVLFVPLIGALQLKQDDRLKDESFLALMKMVIGSLPLIGNPLRGILNPQKEDKN
ncbi:MAG: ADP-ribosylation factor-like protein [Woronichinia naegeliana WA131]|uniref:non-specific serine/threonine protein kinase n=1 Tax=Woronichinia naegeliana WA131 TaxID=2824559 RepID=A0A977KWP8_9CYAN|nr:MAG: ADP-ribosylation factor-like protein [Woronichinia naegeliana WA131]